MARRGLTALLISGAVLVSSLPAAAIPAFARKYGTSCITCHTVYPKLTPFGEAFRRNSFRFPGVDSDYAKQETVTTRAKTPSSEPIWVAAIPPLSMGGNGQVIIHPDKNTSGATSDNNALVNLGGIVSEAHVWAGGTFSDTVSYFAEVTLTPGSADVEHVQVYLNDLIGPAHAVNLRFGRGFSNVSSFGPHSSFLADALLPPSGVTLLNGASTGWNIGDHFNGVELSGVIAGQLGYNVGWNAGPSADVRTAEDVYGHVGYKIGGMSLDGEGKSDSNATRPWEETAVTLDAFAYHSYGSVIFPGAAAGGGDLLLMNTINTVGGGLRAQWGSLELNAGLMLENHKHAEAGGSGATMLSQYDELSYIIFPWLVPAVRIEYSSLSPDSTCQTNGSACVSATDLRVWPGVAMVPYPNIKVVVTALFENASNAPLSGNWSAAGGFGPAPSGSGTEFQNIQIFTAVAF
jgi:hypothetical protein